MSKELIEQLAARCGLTIASDEWMGDTNMVKEEDLIAFAKAYQAAAPSDNRALADGWLAVPKNPKCPSHVPPSLWESAMEGFNMIVLNSRLYPAAPIGNVAEALEKAAKLIEGMPQTGGGVVPYSASFIADQVRALIPDTQANRTEG
jgi:hypothetical protein